LIRQQVHNELFPSTDWRCLLPDPDPDPERVVVLGDGWASTAARRLWPGCHRFNPGFGPPERRSGSADLVVADSFDDEVLAIVRSLLGPGGIAYLESEWPRMKPIGRLRRRLTGSGLDVGACYAIAVGRHRWTPSWWIPVGDPKASRFVADQIKPSREPSRRFRTGLLSLPSRIGLAWPGLVARCPSLLHPGRRHRLAVIVAQPGSPARERDFQPGLRPAGAAPTAVTIRVGGSSTDQPMLFYLNGATDPVAVIKAPSIDEEIESSRHEAGVLRRLSTLPGQLDGVPRPVTVVGADRFPAWGQTYAPGRALARLATPGRLEIHAGQVTEWAVDLARRTMAVMPAGAARTVRRSIEQATLGLGDLPDGELLAGTLGAAIERIDLDRSVRRHGDLGPWNIHLADDGRLTVIDWADSVDHGLPICDLVHFLAHLCLCAHHAYHPAQRSTVIDQLMDPGTACGRVMVDQTTAYAAAIGLPTDRIDDLRVVTWGLDLLGRPSYRWADEVYLELLRAEVRRLRSSP
jgi:hypothetical protein